jgi:hypothetical protein
MAKPPSGDARRKLDRLRALAADPPQQAEYAATLLGGDEILDVTVSALGVLAKQPRPAARPALLERYAWYDANGPRRDPGGSMRAAILRALRDIAQAPDAPLLIRATRTYEPGPQDATAPAAVRAAGLIALFNVDQRAAVYRAVELLADRERTSPFSGEPALTAIRILGAAEEFGALLLYALSNRRMGAEELLGECLKALGGVPPEAAGDLADAFVHDQRELVLLGLSDLLIEHQGGLLLPQFTELLRIAPGDVLRYLVTATVASGRGELLGALSLAADAETAMSRLALYEEGLALAREPAGLAALARVRERLAASRPPDEAR